MPQKFARLSIQQVNGSNECHVFLNTDLNSVARRALTVIPIPRATAVRIIKGLEMRLRDVEVSKK